MIKIDEALIVEGRYDKIKLDSVVDAVIIETNGFGIFKDKEKLELIKKLAQEKGIIILTDSDAAGFQIRARVAAAVPPDRVKHAYIPDVLGKERRKAEGSKEGKLGVEGIDADVLREAILSAGATSSEQNEDSLTKADFYELGLSGRADSAARRQELLKKLELPERMPVNSLLRLVNSIYGKRRFIDILGEMPDKMSDKVPDES